MHSGIRALEVGMLSHNKLVGAIFFLLSGISKYIGGQNIIVDHGFST
jgi:enoyl-[acyl-carrier-protein] reductase (NADH)